MTYYALAEIFNRNNFIIKYSAFTDFDLPPNILEKKPCLHL